MTVSKAIFKARKALDTEWFAQYRRQRDILWDEVVGLSTSLYILEKITAFDFRLFQPREQIIFWHTIANSLYESCIMCAWRIVVDSGSDSLTLAKFKGETLAHITNPKAKEKVLYKVKSVEFEKNVKALGEQIRSLRHSRYGHLKARGVWSRAGKKWMAAQPNVAIESLRKIADTCVALINSLSFEVVLNALPSAYHNGWTDIDLILSSIISRSHVLWLPEKNPITWTRISRDLSQYSRFLFNECRCQHRLEHIESFE